MIKVLKANRNKVCLMMITHIFLIILIKIIFQKVKIMMIKMKITVLYAKVYYFILIFFSLNSFFIYNIYLKISAI